MARRLATAAPRPDAGAGAGSGAAGHDDAGRGAWAGRGDGGRGRRDESTARRDEAAAEGGADAGRATAAARTGHGTGPDRGGNIPGADRAGGTPDQGPPRRARSGGNAGGRQGAGARRSVGDSASGRSGGSARAGAWGSSGRSAGGNAGPDGSAGHGGPSRNGGRPCDGGGPRRRALLAAGLAAAMALAGCSGLPSLVAAALAPGPTPTAAMPDAAPEIALITILHRPSGLGRHTALLINGSQRVLYDPASHWTLGHSVRRGDLRLGFGAAAWDDYLRRAAALEAGVVIQRLPVPRAVADRAIARAATRPVAAPGTCALAVAQLLRQVDGFDWVQPTLLPDGLAGQFARRPGIVTATVPPDLHRASALTPAAGTTPDRAGATASSGTSARTSSGPNAGPSAGTGAEAGAAPLPPPPGQARDQAGGSGARHGAAAQPGPCPATPAAS